MAPSESFELWRLRPAIDRMDRGHSVVISAANSSNGDVYYWWQAANAPTILERAESGLTGFVTA